MMMKPTDTPETFQPISIQRQSPDPAKMEKVKGQRLDVERIKKILLVQLGDLGDILVSFPVLQALKETFSGAKVFIAVHEKATDLIGGCPFLDGVVHIVTGHASLRKALRHQLGFIRRFREERFDLVVDLRTGDRSALLTLLTGARQKLSFYGYSFSGRDNRWWRNRIYTHLIHAYPPRGKQHIVDFYLNPLLAYDISPSSKQPRFDIALHHRTAAAELLRQESIIDEGRPRIALQPFSIRKYKQWPEPNNSLLIQWLIQKYQAHVLIMGTADQRPEADAMVARNPSFTHNMAGKTNLPILAAVLQRCNLSIGVDSFGGHLATAVGTPTVSIFGPGKPVEWAPYGNRTCIVSKQWDCQPCDDTGCDGSERSRCLYELTLEELQAQAKGFIEDALNDR